MNMFRARLAIIVAKQVEMLPKRTRNLILLCVIIGALACCALIYSMRTQSLLLRATKITELTDVEWGRTYWLSDRELICMRSTVRSTTLRLGRKWVCRDLITGKEKTLTALTRIYNQTRDWADCEEFSPDGQWLLWADSNLHGQHAFAAPRDGARVLQWPIAIDGDPIHWMQDGRHWVELVRTYDDKHALLHDVTRPKKATRLPFAAADAIQWHGDQHELILSPKRMFIELNPAEFNLDKDHTTTQIVEASLDTNPMPRATHTLSLPAGEKLIQVAFSPRGDHLAWICTAQRTPSLFMWLLHRMHFSNVRTALTTELWISRMDGRERRLIGNLDIPIKTEEAPDNLRWLPDGKKLSFVYRNALWKAPVD